MNETPDRLDALENKLGAVEERVLALGNGSLFVAQWMDETNARLTALETVMLTALNALERNSVLPNGSTSAAVAAAIEKLPETEKTGRFAQALPAIAIRVSPGSTPSSRRH